MSNHRRYSKFARRTERDEEEYWLTHVMLVPAPDKDDVGLKLMKKMGYLEGEPLGKDKTGKFEPIGQLGITKINYITYGNAGLGLKHNLGSFKTSSDPLSKCFAGYADAVPTVPATKQKRKRYRKRKAKKAVADVANIPKLMDIQFM
jgi:hypothetical protein